MKFRAHETFFIRKGWLSKGMKYVRQTDGLVFIDKEKNPMDELGIGSNMVKSLRYWLQAVDLVSEPSSGRRVQSFTSLGQLVYDNDRYMEELGTLQLLHYKLVFNKDNATSWHFFFNEFNLTEFTQEDFIVALKNYIVMSSVGGEKTSGTDRTLGDDFSCLVNTYFSRKDGLENNLAENNIACPFVELGLVSLLDAKKGIYKKSIPSAQSFNPYIILAVIADCAQGKSEIRLSELLQGQNNIGRVFNLDTITMLEILRDVEKTGELKIIRTAGLDVIHLKNPQNDFIHYVKSFYELLGGGKKR